jgi:hypothetical protein
MLYPAELRAHANLTIEQGEERLAALVSFCNPFTTRNIFLLMLPANALQSPALEFRQRPQKSKEYVHRTARG